MYFDRQEKPIDVSLWSALFEDERYKVVRSSTLLDGKWVSTVWLGMAHGFDRKGRPLIFESMVFSQEGSYNELACARYATLRQARDGHKRMVEKWLLKTGDDE